MTKKTVTPKNIVAYANMARPTITSVEAEAIAYEILAVNKGNDYIHTAKTADLNLAVCCVSVIDSKKDSKNATKAVNLVAELRDISPTKLNSLIGLVRLYSTNGKVGVDTVKNIVDANILDNISIAGHLATVKDYTVDYRKKLIKTAIETGAFLPKMVTQVKDILKTTAFAVPEDHSEYHYKLAEHCQDTIDKAVKLHYSKASDKANKTTAPAEDSPLVKELRAQLERVKQISLDHEKKAKFYEGEYIKKVNTEIELSEKLEQADNLNIDYQKRIDELLDEVSSIKSAFSKDLAANMVAKVA